MTVDSGLYYVTSDGDILDDVVARHYGDTIDGKVEAVLTANPGLAALGAVLDGGVRITLPDLQVDKPAETEQLWG